MGISYEAEDEIDAVAINKSSALPPQTSLAFVASLTMPLVQEVVISADVRCSECRKRITDFISRMNAEPESVVVNIMEKKVTVVCKYPKVVAPAKQITTCKKPLAKLALLRMIFRSSPSR